MSAIDDLLENNNWRTDEADEYSAHDKDLFIWNGDGVPPVEEARGELSRLVSEHDMLMRESVGLMDTIAALRAELDAANKAVDEAREVIRPFSHPDLCKYTAGNKQGELSPVWGKDDALLTIGDFRKATDWLTAHPK